MHRLPVLLPSEARSFADFAGSPLPHACAPCASAGKHHRTPPHTTAHHRVTASQHSNASTLKGPTRPSGSGCSSPVGSAWRRPAASGPGNWAERPEREGSGIRNPSPASCASGATLWRRTTHHELLHDRLLSGNVGSDLQEVLQKLLSSPSTCM